MNHHQRSLSLFCVLIVSGLTQALTAQADEDRTLVFEGHKGPVYSLSTDPSGELVATGAEDMLIHLWDPETGEIRKTLEGHTKPIKYLAFSNDGKYLLSAASTEIRVWNIADGSSTQYKKHVTHVYNVNFNSDASRFLSTSLKPRFHEWDRKEATVTRDIEVNTRTSLVADYSPDDSKIANGSLDRSIKILDAGSGEVIHNISAHGANIMSIDFSPDGKLLASASMDKNVKLWNVENGTIHKLLGGHEYAVVYVRFSPDGKFLLSASYDGTAKLWEISTGSCIYSFVDHKDALYAADFLPDSKHVVTCSNDGTAMVFRITPRFFAEYYYFTELRKEMKDSGLFEDRQKGEKREEYQQRQQEAEKFRKELHEKYYRMHLQSLGE